MTVMYETPNAVQEPPRRILVVDDEPHVLSALRRSLQARGFEVRLAPDGTQALALLSREPVDAIVCDMRMPGLNGAEVLRRSLQIAPEAVRVLLTGHADIASAMAAVNEAEVFRYLAKPWDDAFLWQVLRDGLARRDLERERNALVALTEQQNEQLRRLNAGLEEQVAQRTAELEGTVSTLRRLTERLKTDFSCTVRMLSGLIEQRAGLTARCPRIVVRHVRALGPSLGVTGEALHDLSFAALLHDIGKLALPEGLATQPLEALEPELRQRVLRHPLIGESSLMALPSLKGAAAILGQVNADLDGGGTPAGLQGESISLAARILRVAADFEHYQAGAIELGQLTREQAFRRLRRFRGTRYDGRVVDAFLTLQEQPVVGPAAKVLLSSANLRPGMRLVQDLVSASGALLLAQGHRLEEHHIAHIRRLEEFSGEFLWVTVSADDGREVQVI